MVGRFHSRARVRRTSSPKILFFKSFSRAQSRGITPNMSDHELAKHIGKPKQETAVLQKAKGLISEGRKCCIGATEAGGENRR